MKHAIDLKRKFYIELPDVEDVNETMFMFILDGQKANQLSTDATQWDVSIRDARLCMLFAEAYGSWNLKMKATDFLKHLDSDEPKNVRLVAWVRKVWDQFIKDLLDPNVYAVNS